MSFIARNHPQQRAKSFVDDRETPDEVFAELNERLGPFTVDAAASDHNAKLSVYYTEAADGLSQQWRGGVWCNPPYSNIRPWVEKAWSEWKAGGPDRIVMLLPANRTEQSWWQDLVEPHRGTCEFRVEFLRGRMRFIAAGDSEIRPNARPPFGVCLLIWTVCE